MMENYSGQVHQGCEWLKHSLEDPFADEGSASEDTGCHSMEEFYNDPLSKDAFGHIPNECSNEELSLYLAWKGFQDNVHKGMIEGIRAAFKWHWDST